jgi:hypothetical protein
MRRSQYSCGFQRMLLYWRELAEVGGVESLNLKFCGQQMRCYTDIFGVIGIVSSLL